MASIQERTCFLVLVLAFCSSALSGAVPSVTNSQIPRNPHGFRPWPTNNTNAVVPQHLGSSKRLVAPMTVSVDYHNGPVLTSAISVYIIWYGGWPVFKQNIVRDFINSLSANASGASVQNWWSIVTQYTDQTGRSISGSVKIAGERWDSGHSVGLTLTRLSIQTLIKNSLIVNSGSLPVDSRHGLYIVLSGEEVKMQDFCSSACGFHYFTFPSIVGHTLPYGWVGDSGKQCPGTCAYPYAVPSYMNGAVQPMKSPNGDVGVDGLISVLGHEMAEIATNPLVNAWYAGTTPSAPNEIADICEGEYGTGAGGSYPGVLMADKQGASYNMYGINGRKFLLQWLWSPQSNACIGPNK